ncbi:MAG: imidazoleglycerol-phosphate dehydratase HisB [Acidobacteria bacterium]|nr:imidazoleglycerol-phosphate dehydratase HisB [Acidobacteriota bacterium]
MKPRVAVVQRKTSETEIRLELTLDGNGKFQGLIQPGFLQHMLELLAAHAGWDLSVQGSGDLHVDDHHMTEDLGIAIGRALGEALGDKKGIERYGSTLLPMDEVLVAVAVDLGGRFAFNCDYRPERETVGDLSTELVPHFFRSLAAEARINLHFRFLYPGENEHHRVEAMFKGFARSIRAAARIDSRQTETVPSTKGVL